MTDAIKCFAGQYDFLSNFYISGFAYKGTLYTTAEHAFQSEKTDDTAEKYFIASASTPAQAKQRGRHITLRYDWDRVRFGVMAEVVSAKFAPNTELAHRLIDTYPSHLVEGNYWGDTFWGVCNGVGDNNLGKILEKVRSNLIMNSSAVAKVPDWVTDDEFHLIRTVTSLQADLDNRLTRLGFTAPTLGEKILQAIRSLEVNRDT